MSNHVTKAMVKGKTHFQAYHYTAWERLPFILREGITRGDVPTSPTGGFNAPWLTLNAKAMHPWEDRRKLALRLTVLIPNAPENTERLFYWPNAAKRLGIGKQFYRGLDRAAGGDSKHWFIFMGVIPPEWISEVIDTATETVVNKGEIQK